MTSQKRLLTVLVNVQNICKTRTKERFNIEGASRGMHKYGDGYYMKWPIAISNQEVKAGYYLKTLTPREELAVFLSLRGHCLEDTGRFPESYVAYAQAHELAPQKPDYLALLQGALRRGTGRSVAATLLPVQHTRRAATSPKMTPLPSLADSQQQLDIVSGGLQIPLPGQPSLTPARSPYSLNANQPSAPISHGLGSFPNRWPGLHTRHRP